MRSNQWFLVIAIVALGYVFWQGSSTRYAPPPQRPAAVNTSGFNLDTVAVSDGMTQQALQLDLSKDLDVALLPELGKQAIRSAAQSGLKEQAFLEHALRGISNGVRAISTIDLNGDDVVDPILVRPEPGGDDQYLLLSLQVPAPEAYPLPAAADTEAWKSVETFEVATMTVGLTPEALTVQAQGNEHLYGAAGQQNYVVRDTSSSFLQTYFAIRMLDWMFFPPMFGAFGPGWGYGGYSPTGVGTIAGQRGGVIANNGYSRAPGQAQSAVRTRSGSAPASRYQRAYTGSAPSSLNQMKSSAAFRRRATGSAGSVASGGFGRSGSSAVARSAPATRAPSAVTPRRSSGFSSSVGRSSFGGFGRRSGFGGFRSGGFRFRR